MFGFDLCKQALCHFQMKMVINYSKFVKQGRFARHCVVRPCQMNHAITRQKCGESCPPAFKCN